MFRKIQTDRKYTAKCDELTSKTTEAFRITNRSEITKLNKDIIDHIHSMASESFKSTKHINEKKRKNKNNPWFTYQCRTAKQETNKAAKTVSKFPDSDFLRSNYYKVKKSYKLILKKHKDKLWKFRYHFPSLKKI